MARFQDIPNELLLGILDEVLPDDIVSTALVSKQIHQLALARLDEHRSLQKQYENFLKMVKNESNRGGDPGSLLADLLCRIMTDARLGHYVRKIDLECWKDHARDDWKPDEVFEKQAITGKGRLRPSLRTKMEIMEEGLRAAAIIPVEEVNDWLHQIRCGNEDPLLALLLLYAPKLQTLSFVVPYDREDSSYLLKTIQRIAVQESTSNPYLTCLQNVHMEFAEAWGNMDLLKAFMYLPSLTSIGTGQLFVDSRTYEENSAMLIQPSNVKDLCFQYGCLPDGAISGLLRGMKNLKTFRYEFQPYWETNYTPSFNCSAVLDSLVANAGYTLDRLILSANKIEMRQITPLRGFHTLRDIGIHTFRCFAVEDAKTARKLVGSLPISLERLGMYWSRGTCADVSNTWKVLPEAFVGIIRESTTQLPHLRRLHVDTEDEWDYCALSDCLGSDETAQINPLLSFYIGCADKYEEISAWAERVCTRGQDCSGNGCK